MQIESFCLFICGIMHSYIINILQQFPNIFSDEENAIFNEFTIVLDNGEVPPTKCRPHIVDDDSGSNRYLARCEVPVLLKKTFVF